MANILKTLGAIGVILCLLGMTACSSSTPTPAPTLDLNPFRTEVASTVLAQVTHDLALTPTITPIPSATATSAPTFTPPPPIAAQAVTTTVIVASLTPVVAVVNLAQWVSQSIADDTVFAPGETFTMTWQLRNVGPSVWTAAYRLRFYSGNAFGALKEVLLGRDVPPGDTINISIKMTVPTQPGDYSSTWVMANEKRSNFKQSVFLKIKVVLPPTPTRIVVTATPTTAP